MKNNETAIRKTLARYSSLPNMPRLAPWSKTDWQLHQSAKILIVGQAPGRITHAKGVPFDDPSGNRLRSWMGITREEFYNPHKIAIAPMGFCFPGTGKSGDLPPRPECADTWRKKVLATLTNIELTLIIGRYAIDWHLPEHSKSTITKVALNWQQHWPQKAVLPHPSPRNNRWLKNNPWFEAEIIPMLQQYIQTIFQQP